MAAVEYDLKLVQSVNLSCSPSCPGALAWSQDDRIAVVTEQCVYILTLLSPKNIYCSEMYIEKSMVSWHDKPVRLDVGIDEVIRKSDGIGRERIEWLFQNSLNPMVSGGVNCNSFHSVAWSPAGMDFNHRCIVATLSQDHQVFVHVPSKLSRKWKRTVNITKFMRDYFHKCRFLLDSDETASTTDSSETHYHKKYPDFSEVKRRLNLLSVTCLKWHPTLFDLKKKTDGENLNDFEKFAILTTGSKSGNIMFWKIMAPVQNDMASLEMVGIVNCDCSSLCSLAWYHSDDQDASFLAAGDSNGLIQLFVVEMDQSNGVIEISSQTKYVVWGDRDEMAVNDLHWYHKEENDCLQLLASKGSTVIVFNINTMNGRLSEMPQHYFVNGIHTIGISGLGCSQNGLVVTSATDGTVQHFSLNGANPCTPALIERKETHTCYGVVVSPNGLYIAVFSSPASVLLQSIETYQVQDNVFERKYSKISIMSIVTEEKLLKVLSSLKSCPVDTHLSWDIMEACRQLSVHGNTMPLYNKLSEPCSPLSVSCLYLKLFLERFLVSSIQDPSGMPHSSYEIHGAQKEQLGTLGKILKSLVRSRLEQWRQSEGEVKLPVLLMCDWLVAAFPEEKILDFVTPVYERCGEEKLAEVTKSMAQHFKGQSKHINNYRHIIRETESQIEEMCTKLVKSPQKAPANDGLNLTETPFVSTNNVTPEDSPETIDLSSTDNSKNPDNVKVTEGQKESTSNESTETNYTKYLTPNFTPPTRETCVICGSVIPISRENPLTGTCVNEHTWQRCCVSFLLCSGYEYRRCQTCNRCVCLPTKDLSPQLKNTLKSVRNCPFCTGWFI